MLCSLHAFKHAASPLQKSNSKYGNEHEAIAVYHMMRGVEKFCPIYTLCIGNAFGEAALLLAAGSKVRQTQQQHQQQQQQQELSCLAPVARILLLLLLQLLSG
jgi:ATP-dependent Clp protease protease subunit